MTVAFLRNANAHARSWTWVKYLAPLISPSIGYISAGGNVGYIFCISQSQFDTWQDKGNAGKQFKPSIVIVHVAVSIGFYKISVTLDQQRDAK